MAGSHRRHGDASDDRTLDRSCARAGRSWRRWSATSPTSGSGATGTLGGNLAFADPAFRPGHVPAGGAARRVRLGRGETRPLAGHRRVRAGPYETALEPGELLLRHRGAGAAPGAAMAHLRFAFHERPAATVSAWVRVEDGRVTDARVAVGSVGVVPVAVPGAAEALVGQVARDLDAGAAGLRSTRLAPRRRSRSADGNGADDYKRALVATLVGRARAPRPRPAPGTGRPEWRPHHDSQASRRRAPGGRGTARAARARDDRRPSTAHPELPHEEHASSRHLRDVARPRSASTSSPAWRAWRPGSAPRCVGASPGRTVGHRGALRRGRLGAAGGWHPGRALLRPRAHRRHASSAPWRHWPSIAASSPGASWSWVARPTRSARPGPSRAAAARR